MANTTSAKKALRQQKHRRLINQRRQRNLRENLKTLKQNPSMDQLKQSHSAIDKALKTGIIKKRKANRLKARAAKVLGKSS